jgi:hypothetical protein
MHVQLLQAWAAMKFRRAILLDYGPVDLIRLLGRRCRVVGLRRLPPSPGRLWVSIPLVNT